MVVDGGAAELEDGAEGVGEVVLEGGRAVDGGDGGYVVAGGRDDVRGAVVDTAEDSEVEIKGDAATCREMAAKSSSTRDDTRRGAICSTEFQICSCSR